VAGVLTPPASPRVCLSPSTFLSRPSRGLRPKEPLRLQPHPSCRALSHAAWLWLAAAACGGRSYRRERGGGGGAQPTVAWMFPIRTSRRLLWETALLSGLRANELRHLSIDHVDVEQGGLHLDASWTKNRRNDFLPLPRSLVHRLHTFAATGEAIQKYQQAYTGKEVPRRIPSRPLLYVPRDPARELDKDLQAAAIPKYTGEGKVDFHALRLAYINFVLESGASVKEAQALAQHATPAMTMNVYGRTRNERLVQTVERVGEMVSVEQKLRSHFYPLQCWQ
jgi:integrase